MQSIRFALALSAIFWGMGVSDAAAEKVKILDECDPATFNAIGAGIICDVNFDGGVTFPSLLPSFLLLLLDIRRGGLTPRILRFKPMRRCKSGMTAGKTIPSPRFRPLVAGVSMRSTPR